MLTNPTSWTKFTLDQYDDIYLHNFIKYIFDKSIAENDFIEVKRGETIDDRIIGQIAGLSNAGGGILYFGFDEHGKKFHSINQEKVERSILQALTNKGMKIVPKFHKVNHVEKGLLVSIPILDQPMQLNTENFYRIRSGGQTTRLSIVADVLSNQPLFNQGKTGHVHMSKIQTIFSKFLPYHYSTTLENLHIDLQGKRDQLSNDINKNWIIEYQDWYYDGISDFPIRVQFNSWKLPVTDSIFLQNELVDLIGKIVNLCENVKSSLVNLVEVDTLITLLNDRSERDDLPNNISHRRCLHTLVMRQNIWNFADVRLFITKDNNQYAILFDEAGRDNKRIIGSVDKLDQKVIETKIQSHTKKKYEKKVHDLFEKIDLSTYAIITNLQALY